MRNQDLIEKSIKTSDMTTGGLLNPQQQKQFITLVKKFSVLLPQTRFIEMPRPMMDIDKLWVGEPVTESVDEGTDTGNLSRAKFQRITLAAKKVRSAWNITTEALQGNIEQNEFEQTVMNTMVERIATDLEMLAIQGDTTNTTNGLLRRLDGFMKLTDNAHVVDVKGDSISKGLFASMKRAMPKQYKNDTGLRWLIGDSLAVDWSDSVSDRGTILGDAALQGAEMAPLGTPMVRVPLIPDDMAITVNTGKAAQLVGTKYGPFEISADNDTMSLNIDAKGLITITLNHGTLNPTDICKKINDTLVASVLYGLEYEAFAVDNRMGQIRLESPTLGGASSIVISTVVVASEAYTTLGFAPDPAPADPTVPLAPVTYSGVGSGTYTTANEGSAIFLVNPKNFIWGILDGTRIFTEFNKNTDQIESIVYNQVDCAVENVDAVVKAKNIRRRELTY